MTLPKVSSTALSKRAADRVFDVLVRYGQAGEDDRDQFVNYATKGLEEWRFIGSLGFGGKIRCRVFPEAHVYVDCYPEDQTPERMSFMAFLNDVALPEALCR